MLAGMVSAYPAGGGGGFLGGPIVIDPLPCRSGSTPDGHSDGVPNCKHSTQHHWGKVSGKAQEQMEQHLGIAVDWTPGVLKVVRGGEGAPGDFLHAPPTNLKPALVVSIKVTQGACRSIY